MDVLLALVVVVVGFAIFYPLRSRLDEARIRDFLASKGYRLLSKTWDPYGPGSLGEGNDRIYVTRYQDPNGDIREAHIRVPLLSGVYWTGGEAESSKTETADAFHRDTEISELLDENRELVA